MTCRSLNHQLHAKQVCRAWRRQSADEDSETARPCAGRDCHHAAMTAHPCCGTPSRHDTHARASHGHHFLQLSQVSLHTGRNAWPCRAGSPFPALPPTWKRPRGFTPRSRCRHPRTLAGALTEGQTLTPVKGTTPTPVGRIRDALYSRLPAEGRCPGRTRAPRSVLLPSWSVTAPTAVTLSLSARARSAKSCSSSVTETHTSPSAV